MESIPDLELESPLESDLDELKLIQDDSPYEEVRAAVSNTDDPDMACVFLYLIEAES
jgi:hypothetical protein